MTLIDRSFKVGLNLWQADNFDPTILTGLTYYLEIIVIRKVAPPKPVCSQLPISTVMVYVPTSAASNAVTVRIEALLPPGSMIRGLGSKLASKGFGAVEESS